jgi:arginyl-tRNA synthetase
VANADPISALTAAIAAVAGVPVELERPSDVHHGDYATNVALRLAGARRRPPRR